MINRNDMSNGELHGKVAIVLGASTPGGMGEAVARRLRKEGAKIVVAARNGQQVEALARELDGSACVADITRAEQLEALVAHAMERHGRLDIAVNVVGQAPRVPMQDFSEEHLLQMARL